MSEPRQECPSLVTGVKGDRCHSYTQLGVSSRQLAISGVEVITLLSYVQVNIELYNTSVWINFTLALSRTYIDLDAFDGLHHWPLVNLDLTGRLVI